MTAHHSSAGGGSGRAVIVTLEEALHCDPLPYEVPHPFDLTAPAKTREASDVVWASISNSAAWPVSCSFEDSLAIARNVIQALYASGFALTFETSP